MIMRQILTKKRLVKYAQVYAMIPGIITAKARNFEGIMFKGVGDDYHWDVMKDFLIDGRVIDTQSDSVSNDIMISKVTSKRLKMNVGDPMIVSFFKDRKQIKKRMEVVGIYKLFQPHLQVFLLLLFLEVEQFKK